MFFTIYRTTTGEILRSGSSNTAQPTLANESVLYDVRGDPLTQRVDLSTLAVVAGKYQETNDVIAIRTSLLLRLTKRRLEEENKGITVDGTVFATDDRFKLLLLGVIVYLTINDSRQSIKWPTKTGTWVTLTKSQFTAVFNAAAQHVQSCSVREAALTEQINSSATPLDLTQAVETFWP